MKLVPPLLVLAIAGGVVPSAVAGQEARPDSAPTTVAQAESAQQTSPDVITLAQVSGTEKVLQGCQDVESNAKGTAFDDTNPSYIVFKHLGYQVVNGTYNVPQSVRDSLKTTVLIAPSHGSLVPLIPNSTNFWTYNGNTGYEGIDQATFLVEVGGKRYKVVVNYLVHEVVDPNAVPPACESAFPPRTAPSRGMTFDRTTDAAAFSSWLRTETLSNIIAATSSINLSFADLPGGAVGQTNGNGITLDANPAGYNWFIDPTPADNSEFLPTSNPNEWVAKGPADAPIPLDLPLGGRCVPVSAAFA